MKLRELLHLVGMGNLLIDTINDDFLDMTVQIESSGIEPRWNKEVKTVKYNLGNKTISFSAE